MTTTNVNAFHARIRTQVQCNQKAFTRANTKQKAKKTTAKIQHNNNANA